VSLEPLEFVIICLAAYRLTRFFVKDSLMGFGPDSGSRLSVRVDRFAYDSEGNGRSWWREYVGDLLTCTWCLGFWISAMVYFAYLGGSLGWTAVGNIDWTVHGVSVFSVAGVQGYLNTRMNA